MIQKSRVKPRDIYPSASTFQVYSAAGPIVVRDRAYIHLPSLDEKIECIVLDNTPAALSVGQLIDAGYEFFWEDAKRPRLISPDDQEIPVFVQASVPYIWNESFNACTACAGEETDIYSDTTDDTSPYQSDGSPNKPLPLPNGP